VIYCEIRANLSVIIAINKPMSTDEFLMAKKPEFSITVFILTGCPFPAVSFD